MFISKTSRPQLEAREHEQGAFELRRAGATYSQIGAKLGITKQAAHAAVKRVLAEIIELRDGDREHVRALELDRLDAMLLGQWAKAAKGDAVAVERVLSIMKRRSLYLGLDEPTRTEVEASITKAEEMTDEQLLAIAAKAVAKAEGGEG